MRRFIRESSSGHLCSHWNRWCSAMFLFPMYTFCSIWRRNRWPDEVHWVASSQPIHSVKSCIYTKCAVDSMLQKSIHWNSRVQSLILHRSESMKLRIPHNLQWAIDSVFVDCPLQQCESARVQMQPFENKQRFYFVDYTIIVPNISSALSIHRIVTINIINRIKE